MKQITVYPNGIAYKREMYTAAQVLEIVACQGTTELDMNGKEVTAAEAAADWGKYMFLSGMLLGAYLNGIITAEEQHNANALWHMLRYGNICDCKITLG